MTLMVSRCEWGLTLLDREVGGDRGREGLMRFGEEDVNVAEMTDVEPLVTFVYMDDRNDRSMVCGWVYVCLVITIQLDYERIITRRLTRNRNSLVTTSTANSSTHPTMI